MSSSPEWHLAARELVHGFHELTNAEQRIRVMEKLCERLGGCLYPAFLQLLFIIERDASTSARELVAGTLVQAIRSCRLPAGRVPAWGARSNELDASYDQRRSLGPIEYLCAWHGQPSELPTLDRVAFDAGMTRLLRLVSDSTPARILYCNKLLADANDPLEGSLANSTRAALHALATQWQTSAEPQHVLDAWHGALGESASKRLANVGINPFI